MATKVSSTEFQKNLGTYTDIAMREPVIITSHKREKLVLIAAHDYYRLKNMDPDPPAEPDAESRIEEFMEKHRHTIEKLAQ